MKKNKGFTLVELLAVIAILAILVIIAVPNVLKTFNNAKKNTFLTEVRTIHKQSATKYVTEKAKGRKLNKISSLDDTKLDLESNELDYCIILDNDGKAKSMFVGNNSFHIILDDVSNINNIKPQDIIEGKLEDTTCSKSRFNIRLTCTFDGDLNIGSTYINGQYLYTYRQYYDHFLASDVTLDKGWHVTLKDPDLYDPVTSDLCATINDEPITSMRFMFENSNPYEIDFSSFDTSEVTDMSYMFQGSYVSYLDLSNFNTSKVTEMHSMFRDVDAEYADLTSFDTSNVTQMDLMFEGSRFINLDLSSFDTRKVRRMYNMFRYASITNLDVSSFDTSNVESMEGMFRSFRGALNLRNFTFNDTTNYNGFLSDCVTPFIFVKDTATANKLNETIGGYGYNSLIPENNCTYNGTLMQGTTFTNGQYTYKYKQQATSTGWENITTDGWGVSLTDKTSTQPITSLMCSSINDKPIVSTSYMFYQSNSTALNIPVFETYNVENMNYMFAGTKFDNINLYNLTTNNVKTMKGMFSDSLASSIVFFKSEDDITPYVGYNNDKIISLNENKHNIKKVARYALDLTMFATSIVEDMSEMFKNTRVNVIEFYPDSLMLNNLKYASHMFDGTTAEDIILPFSYTALEDTSYMFANTNNLIDIGFTIFIDDRTNADNMFIGSSATGGIALTDEIVTILNNSTGKPQGLIFELYSSK